MIDINQPDAIVSEITFFYKSEKDKENIDVIIKGLVQDCEVDYEESETNKINAIGLSNNGLELERVDTIELYDGNCYYCYISGINQLNKNNIISLRIKKPND